MIQTSVEVTGLEELESQLTALCDQALAKRQVQSALMKAAQPMVKTMKARAPRAEAAYFRYYRGSARQRAAGNVQASRVLNKPGKLRRSIRRTRVKLPNSAAVGIYIGTVKHNGSKYYPFYWRFLEFGTPKMAAKPFIRNSFDNEAQNSLNIFKQRLRENIQKIIEKRRIAEQADPTEDE